MNDYESCDGLALAERLRQGEISAAELLEVAMTQSGCVEERKSSKSCNPSL